MGIASATFKNSSTTYTIELENASITTQTFNVEGDFVLQQGNKNRSVKDVYKPIVESSVRINAIDNNTLFDELQGLALGDVIYRLKRGSNVIWTGFLQTISTEKSAYWGADVFLLKGIDGLSTLKSKQWEIEGTIQLNDLIAELLNGVSEVTSALYVASWNDTNQDSESPEDIRFNISDMIRGLRSPSYYTVLELMCERFGLTCSLVSEDSLSNPFFILKERHIQGSNRNGWTITLSSGSVGFSIETDSRSISLDNVDADYRVGTLTNVSNIYTNFNWQVDSPFLSNSNFQSWLDGDPQRWVVESGTFTEQTDANGQTVARSTDNGELSQIVRVVKPAFVQSGFILSFQTNAGTPGSGTFSIAQIAFIDPNGVLATQYLEADGFTTTTATDIEYNATPPVSGVTSFSLEISLRETIVLQTDRIVEITLKADRTANTGTGAWSWVQFQSVQYGTGSTIGSEPTLPNRLLTSYTTSNNGTQLNNEFNISDQGKYNSIGSIQVWNGSAWVNSSDWGTSETIDEIYTEKQAQQYKDTLKYYDLTILPTDFNALYYSDGFTFLSDLYTPVYLLKNYSQKTTDLRLVELKTSGTVTINQRYVTDV